MLKAYRDHVAERAALGIPPLPLDAKQVAELIELIKNPPAGEDAFLLDLLTHRVPPGVDDAAKVKASFLAAVAHGDIQVSLISKAKATELLGTMVGGYNVHPLIELLDDAEVAGIAAEGLKKTLLMFDYFNDVAAKATAGNAKAQEVMQSWADAEWFTSRPEVPKSITVTVFKVPGETNTDDLSPAPDATTRPDIPMHYLAMLKNTRPDAAFKPEEDGKRGPIQFIEDLKKKGNLVAYVGDVVGTGSSRKSATNSVIWATGQDIPYVPNKRFGGDGADFGVAEHVDQRLDVVAAEHGAEQLGRLDAGDQRTGFLTLGHLGQELGLDLGGVIDAGGNAIADQLDQSLLFPFGRVLKQTDHFLGLLGAQRQRRNTEGCAFSNMCTVRFEHKNVLSEKSKMEKLETPGRPF